MFTTARLNVAEWHRPESGIDRRQLPTLVVGLLSPDVTAQLPPGWQGSYTLERAEAWARERDHESAVLVAVERGTGDVVGLALLGEVADASGGIQVRLGYLLGREHWGGGLASELVAGLVGWCRSQPEIHSIVGGVATDNRASARVLEKNGFICQSAHAGEQMYELAV